MLAFSVVHGKFHRMAAGQVKGLVHMQQHLYVVIAFRQGRQLLQRITKCFRVESQHLTRLHGLYVHAKNLLGGRAVRNLKTRLFFVVGRNQDEQAPVQGFVGQRIGQGYRKSGSGRFTGCAARFDQP